MHKMVLAALSALLLSAGSAFAVTITNEGSQEITVGIDEGNTEHVKKVPAGKSMTFKDECKNGCGLTGPWGYSRMAKPGEKFVFEDGELKQQGS